MPDRLHFTGNEEADRLLVDEPMALLIGFALDQQVPVPTAFTGPLKLKQRLGTLDPGRIATTDPGDARGRVPGEAGNPPLPREHGPPGAGAGGRCGGALRREGRAALDRGGSADDLRTRIEELPGFGEMKVKALGAVLAKRFGVEAAEGLVPGHPTLGDVDSDEALASYQAAKRAYKASLKAQT